ncbi:MAG: pentapeptide repeat-containing protein [Ktedonobacteraceae bacterium]
MANQQHLALLKQGVEEWNEWRKQHPEEQPALSGADLRGMNLACANLDGANLHRANLRSANLHMAYLDSSDLTGANLIEADLHFAQMQNANLTRANLRKANLHNVNLEHAHLDEAKLYAVNFSRAHLNGAHLHGSDLRKTHLHEADLREADLSEADVREATLRNADLSGAHLFSANFIDADLRGATLRNADLRQSKLSTADLRQANVSGADLRGAILTEARLNRANLLGANLSGANLTWSILSEADLSKANLSGCSVYAISAWNVDVSNTIQTGLIITQPDEPTITVDNLEVAQFIYLLLNNQKIRDVIDTVAKKVVLILGRFTPPRKAILDAIRDELRKHDYLPVLFDFDKPSSRDTFETITTLARLSRFIIADITNPKSIPGELVSIVEALPSLPVQPLLRYGSKPWGMYEHIKRYPWVLELHRYKNLTDLLPSLGKKVIEPAEQKAKELAQQ